MDKRGLAKIYKEAAGGKISQRDAIKSIDEFLETVEEALKVDGKVMFFKRGVFEILERKPRIVTNPFTLELMKIYPKNTVKFRASKKVNEKQ